MAKHFILIVEDDDAIRESIVELMSEEGFEVTAMQNGALGLDFLQKAQALPDLILLDLMMPVMDGFEFCRQKAAEPAWADIPTVVMSADGHIVQKQSQTGAAAYIKKPLDIDDLIGQVRSILPAAC